MEANYSLSVTASGFEHPPFPYESRVLAQAAMDKALSQGFYRFEILTGDRVYIQLGAGSVLRVRSEEVTRGLMERAEAHKKREQGLIAPADKQEDHPPWVIVIQQGENQLPPLFFGSDVEAEAVIHRALAEGLIKRTIKLNHEYVSIQTGPGTVYMVMTTEQYEKQQAQARVLAARALQQRQQQQQQMMRQLAQAGGVIPRQGSDGPSVPVKGPLIFPPGR